MTEQEKRFLHIYRRTLDPGEAFLAAGIAVDADKSPEQNGKLTLRRLKKRLRELEERDAELDMV